MSLNCTRCGRTIEGEGVAFCPYCGEKLAAIATVAAEPRDEEAEKWIEKAHKVTSYPDRKKILLQGMKACPGSRDLEWEMLFIGQEEPKKRGLTLDFSIIKSYILDIYNNPGEFNEERKNRMRSQLFDAPELKACFERFDDPERKQREYIQRLCNEYVTIFLEGSSQVMGRLFGFSLERNKEKKLAAPVGQMIKRIRADEKLSPEQREQLWKSMVQAYAARTGGRTEHLDQLI